MVEDVKSVKTDLFVNPEDVQVEPIGKKSEVIFLKKKGVANGSGNIEGIK